MRRSIAALVLAVLLSGCGGREPGSKQLTKGTLHIGCDEAVATLIRHEADQFTHLYTDAVIDIRPEEAREVIARFAADSLRVIAVGRELNKEERDALTAAKVEFREYHVAQTAVAVIANFDVPVKQLRVGELDTIFAGARTRWPGKGGMMIELAVGGLNAGVNEVFRQKVLGGSGYDRAAKPFTSSTMLIDYVGHTRGALGIVGLDWLKDHDAHVTVLGVATSITPLCKRTCTSATTPSQRRCTSTAVRSNATSAMDSSPLSQASPAKKWCRPAVLSRRRCRYGWFNSHHDRCNEHETLRPFIPCGNSVANRPRAGSV